MASTLRGLRNLERGPGGLALLTLIAAVLFVGALAGIAWIAGFGAVHERLERVQWPWLGASGAGMLVAFGGYRLAFEGIARVSGGPKLSRRDRSAVVVAGFGGFVARGGSAVDRYAMEAAGAGEREAKVRVAGLDSLEHVPIALGGCAAAITLLVAGTHSHPPLDFLWPWAVAPLLGGALAVWAARRYRQGWRDASGWRGLLGIGLDGVWMLFDLVDQRTAYGLPYLGMCVFWAGDLFALWAALAAFDFRLGVPALIVAYAIGYALTRRTAPLGGAGMIETFLPLTLWDSGAPLAAAVAGVLAYRVANLWLPMPAAFAMLPRLRAIGRVSRQPRPPRIPLRRRLRAWLDVDHRSRRPRDVALFVGVGAVLAVGALAANGWAAGFGRLHHLLATADWFWFPIAVAGEACAYVGYVFAYRETARVEDGATFGLPRVAALVAVGFGVFIPRGGFTADYEAFVESGLPSHEARRRVLGLGALEYAILAPATCAAAIYLIARGADVPWSFTIPWAVAVPVGGAVALLLLRRRDRWRGRGVVRDHLAHGLDAVAILLRFARLPREGGAAAGVGMALYWAGDIFCLWACLQGFLHHTPPVPTLLVGYATGYALTRRALPLAGAGAVEALLPLALAWVTIPLAPALLAVLAYRIFNLWLPLVPALAGYRQIRASNER